MGEMTLKVEIEEAAAGEAAETAGYVSYDVTAAKTPPWKPGSSNQPSRQLRGRLTSCYVVSYHTWSCCGRMFRPAGPDINIDTCGTRLCYRIICGSGGTLAGPPVPPPPLSRAHERACVACYPTQAGSELFPPSCLLRGTTTDGLVVKQFLPLSRSPALPPSLSLPLLIVAPVPPWAGGYHRCRACLRPRHYRFLHSRVYDMRA